MYSFLCVNHTLIKWFKRKKTYLRKGISEVQVLLVLAKLNTKYINMKYELWYYVYLSQDIYVAFGFDSKTQI